MIQFSSCDASAEQIMSENNTTELKIANVVDITGQCMETDNNSAAAYTMDEMVYGASTSQQSLYDNAETETKFSKSMGKRIIKGPMGRKLEEVWKEFEVTQLGPSKKMTICKHCQAKTSVGAARAYRLRKHLMRCNPYLQSFNGQLPVWLVTQKPKKSNVKTMKKKSSASHTNVLAEEEQKLPESSSSQSQRPAISTTNENETLDLITSSKEARISSPTKVQLDRQLLKFLMLTKTPLTLVENKEFRRFLEDLKPDYDIPNLDELNGPIFKSVYHEMRSDAESDLRGEKVVLIQGGWSNRSYCGERLITHILHHTKYRYFLTVAEISSDDNENDGFHCTTMIKDAISLAENKYKCNVVGLVTDNVNQFQEIKDLMATYYPRLHVQPSHLHLLLYAGQSLVNHEVMEKVLKIFRYFRNHDYQCAKIKEGLNHSQTLLIRWNHNFRALEAFIKDREKYIEILTDPKYKTSSQVYMTGIQIPVKGNAVDEAVFLEILNNTSLTEIVHEMNSLLTPIQDALIFLQKEECTLADAIFMWLSLSKNEVFSGEKGHAIEECKQIALSNSGIATYILHPKYKGSLLSEEDEMERGRQFIMSVNYEYLDPVVAFIQSDERVYPSSMINNNVCTTMDPLRWWKAQLRNAKLPPGFVDFTLSLLVLVANSSSWDKCLQNYQNDTACEASSESS